MIRRAARLLIAFALAAMGAASAALAVPATSHVMPQAALPPKPLVRAGDPPVRALDWREIETPHFRIRFTPGLERDAATIAETGEQIWEPITDLYRYRPPERTIITLRDHGDLSNGFAAYFQNRIEIWATNLDFEFRGTHDWLRDVTTHEFTHIVSLGAAMKAPAAVPQVYFQYFGLEPEKRTDVAEGLPRTLVSIAVPTVTVPLWFAEGVAQYQADGVRADWWDAHRDMVLRTAILSGRELSYQQMEGFYDHDGREAEMVYDHGYAFVRYLARTYGDSALRELAHDMGGWTTWSFDRALQRLTGKPGSKVYEEWIARERARYEAFADARSAEPAGERFETPKPPKPAPAEVPIAATPGVHGFAGQPGMNGRPRCREFQGTADVLRSGYYRAAPVWSPDGGRIAYLSNEGQDYTIPSVRIRSTRGDTTSVAPESFRATSTVSWFPDGRSIVFSRRRRDDSNRWSYNDLVVVDLARKKAHDLTRRWRATYPIVAPDGHRIAFVHNERGTTNLMLLDIDADTIRALTHWTDGTQVYTPRWSPDGTMLAASISRGRERHVAIFRVEASGGSDVARDSLVLVRAFASTGDDRDPAWTCDGRGILFASSADGVFNLYEADLATGRASRITNVLGGAFSPDVGPDGHIAYASYEAGGYTIRILRGDTARTPVDSTMFADRIPPAGTLDELTLPSKRIDRRVPQFQTPALLPRIGRYDGHWRVGAYAFTGDAWDDALLFGGLWVAPDNLDYDAFVTADAENALPWPLTLDVARTVRSTSGDTVIAERLSIDGIRYGLNSVSFSLKPRWRQFDFDLHGLYQRFDAKINQTLLQNDARIYVGYNYTYYHGGAVGLAVSSQSILPFTTRDIAPQGLRWQLRYDRWWNRFFQNFDTGSGLAEEVYTPYGFDQVSLDAAYYRAMPWNGEHTLGIEGRAMLIDAKTDSFFYEGIGGIIGLRGYTYYQLQGRRTAWGRLIYRFPVPGAGSLDRKIGPVYADKIYLAAFAEAGRVWRDVYPNAWAAGLKRDVGAELRADLFSFYGYPSRLSISYARALDAAPGTDRTKVYVTVLFGYL